MGTQPNTATGTQIAPDVEKIMRLHNVDAPLKRSQPASTVEETTWPAIKVSEMVPKLSSPVNGNHQERETHNQVESLLCSVRQCIVVQN
ncbi:GM26676 [Drosophila sechellia]|uniref:GM26676 n=1 Tax=Drosophila sechellia TaxID=7238 RepID=B4IPE4_DROSE|nr:GM26676 [Drosophila sechellia]